MQILFIILAFSIIGCSSEQKKDLKITSTPSGAKIDVNGFHVGTTPKTIQVSCTKTWVGLLSSSDGWEYKSPAYHIEVFPIDAGQTSQTKTINACQTTGADANQVDFDLRLDKVTPVQRIGIEQK